MRSSPAPVFRGRGRAAPWPHTRGARGEKTVSAWTRDWLLGERARRAARTCRAWRRNRPWGGRPRRERAHGATSRSESAGTGLKMCASRESGSATYRSGTPGGFVIALPLYISREKMSRGVPEPPLYRRMSRASRNEPHLGCPQPGVCKFWISYRPRNS